MRIITISREFGSGGRELGKRLSDALGIPCYDHEIIDMVAEKHGLDKNYVSHISEKDIRVFYPSTIGHRFLTNQSALQQPVTECAAYRELFTEDKWGRKECYHLCINTSGKEIKNLVPAVAAYANAWFGQD